MDYFFERIGSLIPVFLGIIWILRLLGRRRGNDNRNRNPSQQRPEPGTPKNQNTALQISEPPVQERAAVHIWPGSDSAERPLAAERPAVAAPALQKAGTAPEKTPFSSVAKEQNAPEQNDLQSRLQKLSPPAQGIVWSFILDRPPALKDLE